MTISRPLPTLGGAGEIEPGSTRPDPERLAAGWEHRFVAAGARAQEMIELYRELGYEVVADPVQVHTQADGCVVCFSSGGETVVSIYTRRPDTGRESEG